ncbi:hypothetical protein GCM10010211_25880 [Streptomyces albospinus]|uniref:Uncharacterized protein n=1 Tax=Streptomyces albospinus TaxID=285515 RepID=A0ABQ2UZ05_9ACTN|nr:hypothetical protein GCM10010211_25880 [Streptomyces albospinus]
MPWAEFLVAPDAVADGLRRGPGGVPGRRAVRVVAQVVVAAWTGPGLVPEPGKDGLLFVGEKRARFRGSSFGRKGRRARAAVRMPENLRFYGPRHTGHTLATRSGATLQGHHGASRPAVREGRNDLPALRP